MYSCFNLTKLLGYLTLILIFRKGCYKMTEEVKNDKRVNKVTDVEVYDLMNPKLGEIVKSWVERIEKAGASLYDVSNIFKQDENGNTIIDLSRAGTHNLRIIPQKDGDNLAYVAFALTPKFDAIANCEMGLTYLKNCYNLFATRKIRDALRQAVLSKREYTAPIDIADFVTVQRKSSESPELKQAIAGFVKLLLAKFASKGGMARAVLTASTMKSALANEQYAKQVYPFLVEKSSGNTILDKWLEKTKSDFESKGLPTNELSTMLATRHSVTFEGFESDDDSLESLF